MEQAKDNDGAMFFSEPSDRGPNEFVQLGGVDIPTWPDVRLGKISEVVLVIVATHKSKKRSAPALECVQRKVHRNVDEINFSDDSPRKLPSAR